MGWLIGRHYGGNREHALFPRLHRRGRIVKSDCDSQLSVPPVESKTPSRTDKQNIHEPSVNKDRFGRTYVEITTNENAPVKVSWETKDCSVTQRRGLFGRRLVTYSVPGSEHHCLIRPSASHGRSSADLRAIQFTQTANPQDDTRCIRIYLCPMAKSCKLEIAGKIYEIKESDISATPKSGLTREPVTRINQSNANIPPQNNTQHLAAEEDPIRPPQPEEDNAAGEKQPLQAEKEENPPPKLAGPPVPSTVSLPEEQNLETANSPEEQAKNVSPQQEASDVTVEPAAKQPPQSSVSGPAAIQESDKKNSSPVKQSEEAEAIDQKQPLQAEGQGGSPAEPTAPGSVSSPEQTTENASPQQVASAATVGPAAKQPPQSSVSGPAATQESDNKDSSPVKQSEEAEAIDQKQPLQAEGQEDSPAEPTAPGSVSSPEQTTENASPQQVASAATVGAAAKQPPQSERPLETTSAPGASAGSTLSTSRILELANLCEKAEIEMATIAEAIPSLKTLPGADAVFGGHCAVWIRRNPEGKLLAGYKQKDEKGETHQHDVDVSDNKAVAKSLDSLQEIYQQLQPEERKLVLQPQYKPGGDVYIMAFEENDGRPGITAVHNQAKAPEWLTRIIEQGVSDAQKQPHVYGFKAIAPSTVKLPEEENSLWHYNSKGWFVGEYADCWKIFDVTLQDRDGKSITIWKKQDKNSYNYNWTTEEIEPKSTSR